MADDGAPVAETGGCFMDLRLLFHEVANLLRCPGRKTAPSRMFIRTTLEPGNITAVTTAFTTSEQLPLDSVMRLPPSLCLVEATSSRLLVELWRVFDEGGKHELVGSCSPSIDTLVKATPSTRLTLTRRSGNASVTSLTVSATTSFISQQSRLQVSDVVTTSGEKTDLELTFVVLEVVGLEEDQQPVLTAALRSDGQTSVCWSDVGVADMAVATTYIWNYQWQLSLISLTSRDEVVELRVFTDDSGEASMKAEVSVASLMTSNVSSCESWIPFLRSSDVEVVDKETPRALVAWCWTPYEAQEDDQRGVQGSTTEKEALQDNDHGDLKPPSVPKLTLPSLSSTISIGIQSLCRLSSETTKWVSRSLELKRRDSQQLLMRIQLVSDRDPPSSDCSVSASSVRLVSDHCLGQVCAVPLGDCIATAQLPMTAELASSLPASGNGSDERIHQAVIKVQPSASQSWGLSSTFAVAPVLREITLSRPQIGWRFAMLDHEEAVAGEVVTVVAYGSPESSNGAAIDSASLWTHDPQPRRALCYLSALDVNPTWKFEARASTGTRPLQLRIWTTTTGRRGGFTLTAGDDGATSPSCELVVYDISCEVFHVELYRIDDSRRVLGVGDFTGTATSVDTVIEKQVTIYSPRERIEVANAVVQVTVTGCEDSCSLTTPESVMMASLPSLRGVSYLSERSKGGTSLSLYVEQLQLCQTTARDRVMAASVELRLSTQSRWSSSTQWAVAGSQLPGQAVVVFDEHFETPIRWSTKDRCPPVLQIRVKLRQQQQQQASSSLTVKAKSEAVKTVKTTTSSPIKLQGSGTPLSGTSGASSSEQFDLDLTAFFAHSSGYTRLHIPLAAARSSKHEGRREEKGQSVATLLLQVRVGSDREDQRSDRSLELLPSSQSQSVDGDACVHLQQASGAFVQAQDGDASSYIVTLEWMGTSASTCQVNVNRDRKLEWNEHLTLPISCEAAPMLQLSILKRSTNSFDISEQLVATTSFPVFPSLSTNQHLIHCELPLSLPLTISPSATAEKNPVTQDRRRVGVLSMDIQFITRPGPELSPNDPIDLAIHELRGVAASIVRLEVYALKDSSANKRHRIWSAPPVVVSLGRSRDSTMVNEVVDLSGFEAPNDGSTVVAVGVLDAGGETLGVAHIALHKNWRKRLLSPSSRPNWYKLIGEHPIEAAVLVSFQRPREDVKSPMQSTGRGGLFLGVRRAVGHYSLGINGASTAAIELSSGGTKRRTRRAAWSVLIDGWQWEDEWIPLHQAGLDHDTRLQCELVIDSGLALPSRLTGELHVPFKAQVEDEPSMTEWVPLSASDEHSASQAAQVFVLVQVVRLPPVVGTIVLRVRSIQSLGREHTELQVDNSFLSCTFNSKTATALVVDQQAAKLTEEEYVSLRIPITTGAMSSMRAPVLVVSWVGESSSLGQVCFGTYTIDLTTCLSSRQSTRGDVVWSWNEFRDRVNCSRTTAIAQMSVTFHPTSQQAVQQTTRPVGGSVPKQPVMRDNAETLAVWKKLFYLLDKDGNGVVDLEEFTELFTSNLDDLKVTSDGKKLLTLLLDSDSAVPDFSRRVRTLFAAMDSDGDKRIQWSEYLAFLRQRQHQLGPRLQPDLHEATPRSDCSVKATPPTSCRPQPDPATKTEKRQKHREDRGAIDPPNVDTPSSTRPLKPLPSRSALPVLGKSELELNAKLVALAATLELEKQRYTALHESWQALQRSHHQLQLKQQQDAIQEQLRAKRVTETIAKQEAQLRDREASRKRQHDASIVLQGSLRSRLEQKRYQAVKMSRINAATTLQCWYRQRRAVGRLKRLKEEEESRRVRYKAAVKLQRFVRRQLRRKERQLILEASRLSALVIQKTVRGMLARVSWTASRRACVLIQCWVRQVLAKATTKRLRGAYVVIFDRVRRWVCKWRYQAVKKSAARLQRWWRRVYAWRCDHLEQVEAAVCVQAAWRGKRARVGLGRRREQREVLWAKVKAVVSVQSAWRQSRRRARRRLTAEASSEPNMDTATAIVSVDLRPTPVQGGGDGSAVVRDATLATETEEEEGAFVPDDYGDELLPPDGSTAAGEAPPEELSTLDGSRSIGMDVMQAMEGMLSLVERNVADAGNGAVDEGQRLSQLVLDGRSINTGAMDELPTTRDDRRPSFTDSPDCRGETPDTPTQRDVEDSGHVAQHEPCGTAPQLSAHVQECSSGLANGSGMNTALDLPVSAEPQPLVVEPMAQVVQVATTKLEVGEPLACDDNHDIAPASTLLEGGQSPPYHDTLAEGDRPKLQPAMEENPASALDPPHQEAQQPGSRLADTPDRDSSLYESEDDREPRGDSSVESSDLVWDADAISGPLSSAESPGRSPANRMDSERILSDLRRLERPS